MTETDSGMTESYNEMGKGVGTNTNNDDITRGITNGHEDRINGYEDMIKGYNAGTRDYDAGTRGYNAGTKDYDSITRSYRREREGVGAIGLD